VTPRRALFDPLQPSSEPRWYVVRGAHGAVLEKRSIDAGTDLKRLFARALLEWIDAGWSVGEFSSCAGTFFCSRGIERRTVTIQSTDPDSERGHGGSRLRSP
jgi:hypothetical protein